MNLNDLNLLNKLKARYWKNRELKQLYNRFGYFPIVNAGQILKFEKEADNEENCESAHEMG